MKSGTGNEREKRWGMDRRNDNGPDLNPCPPWASSPYVVGATACATVPPMKHTFLCNFVNSATVLPFLPASFSLKLGRRNQVDEGTEIEK